MSIMKAERNIAVIPSEAFTSNPAVLLSTKKLYEIASNTEISGGTIRVLLFILRRANNEGEVCISPTVVAKILGMGSKSIRKALTTLEEYGIVVLGKENRHTMIRISEGIVDGIIDC